MEKFEQLKMLEYLYNSLNNSRFCKTNLSRIVEWHADAGKNIIPFSWQAKENDDLCFDTKDFVCSQKTTVRQKAQKFAEKISKKLKALPKTTPSFIEKKISFVAQLLNLTSEEKEVFGFFARMKVDDYFDDFNRDICSRNNKLKQSAALFLNFPPRKIENLLDRKAALLKFGLLEGTYSADIEATNLTAKLMTHNISSADDVKTVILGNVCKASLQWKDFSYLEEKDFCAKILKQALKNKESGINLLFYGEPGTGKTEFAKTLAAKINADLYSVGENFDDSDRKETLNIAYSLLEKDTNTCLLIDEADDFLTQVSFGFGRARGDSKLYVNRILENNKTPAVWIINSIDDIDKAYLRRFTFALNFSKPNLKTRTEMWQKSLKAHKLPADKKTAEEFATEYKLSPSFITVAVKSARLIGGGLSEVKKSLNSLQRAYNNGHLSLQKKKPQTAFNPNLLNTDTNLILLADRIKLMPHRNFSLCLYGASGTGKSAYAEFLADTLEMPVLKKKCSDLLSKWVGGTEQNIADAFAEAKENQAVLIFDEADSFLQDRTQAVRSWEVTQVNEMLTQMESYPYPFVCTTNLMDSLDKASLRRFTFKVAYDYMTPEQACLAFQHFFGIDNVDLAHLPSLAPGDFVVVKQKAEILGLLKDKNELIKMLEQEQLNKAPVHHKIGFM